MNAPDGGKRRPGQRLSVRGRIVITLLLWLSLLVPGAADELQEALRERIEAFQAGFGATVGERRLLAEPALVDFYIERGFEPAWLTSAHLGNQVNALLQSIRGARWHGLRSEDYHERAIVKLMSAHDNGLSEGGRVDLELLLSDAFLSLGVHLSEGKLIDRSAFRQNSRELLPLLEQGLASQSVGPMLATVGPQQPGYRGLLEERRRLAALEEQAWPKLTVDGVLRPGDTSPDVTAIGQRLQALGDLGPAFESSERYDNTLVAAVRRFQSRHGLTDDGVIGPRTLSALNRTPRSLLQSVDASLEHWRWLPEQLGERYISLNLADRRLTAVMGENTAIEQSVELGSHCAAAPIQSHRLHYLVVNPAWIVPPDVAVNEVWPQVQGHPDRLERAGFQLFAGWGAQTRVLDLDATDWSRLDDRPAPYRLVQAPGPRNALGRIAFRFEGGHQFMHGMPEEPTFATSAQPFSPGCVRLGDARQLAEWVLAGDAKWSPAALAGQLDSGTTRTLSLDMPIPVYFDYRTAWVDSDRGLMLVPDWKDKDTRVVEGLKQPLQERF